MKIDAYSFGSMTVNGREFNQDLIIFPERVVSGWWRKEGHTLSVEDLGKVIKYKPEVLVVGRGASGVMVIPESTQKLLKEKNIELIEGTTGEVYKIFNEYIRQGKKVVGAFHISC
jgi:hypothetical protein